MSSPARGLQLQAAPDEVRESRAVREEAGGGAEVMEAAARLVLVHVARVPGREEERRALSDLSLIHI